MDVDNRSFNKEVKLWKNFKTKEAIVKSMMKYYPMAAIDVETAKYYKPEDMTKMKLE